MRECVVCGWSGEPVDDRCPNCRMPLGAPDAALVPEDDPITAELREPTTLERGIAELARALGVSADHDAGALARGLARALAEITAGYDGDPEAIILEVPRDAPCGSGVTLSLDAPVRVACSRCWLPVLGRLVARWREGGGGLSPDRLRRVAFCLASRLQSEGELAEQLAAAACDLGGARSVEVVVTLRRPCGECGGGQSETTARARRASPAGGDPPHVGGAAVT